MAGKRIDVLSDTHGRLSNEVLDALDGCDLIVHAGDICATGYGEVHGLENRGTEPVELIALIVGE